MNQNQILPCLCQNTRRAANALTKYYDKAFADSEITTTQFALLKNIQRLGSTNITDLTQVVKLEKSTLTRTLAPLIDAEYIHSERGKNKREIILSLTEKGEEKVASALPAWQMMQAEITDFLGGEENAWDFISKLLKLQDLTTAHMDTEKKQKNE